MKLTKENAQAMIPLLQAVADGKVIQTRNPEGGWVDLKAGNSLLLASEPSDYRIKPEPQVIWVNFYENLGPCVHPSEEAAKDNANSKATRIAVRFVEDTTNGK